MPAMTLLGEANKLSKHVETRGRKPKSALTAQVQQILNEAALYAVQMVRDNVRGRDAKGHKVQPISGTKAKLCELAIAHAIGLPRQKIDVRHFGDLLTLTDLARLAREMDNPRLPEPDPELLVEPVINVTPVEIEDAKHT